MGLNTPAPKAQHSPTPKVFHQPGARSLCLNHTLLCTQFTTPLTHTHTPLTNMTCQRLRRRHGRSVFPISSSLTIQACSTCSYSSASMAI